MPSAKARKREPSGPSGETGEKPSTPWPVVGMGASAGGLEAFQKFFGSMPADSGMAFVLAQHLDPRHETMVPELLSRITTMRVQQARDQLPMAANEVYVIPPNALLTVEGGVLRVQQPRDPGTTGRMAIDMLFRSLAEDQGGNAVCLLFSGSGTDGTLGLRAVKEHGGMAMAQTPDSAKHDSILRSAISTGMVDHVLRPEDMPAKLVEFASFLREARRQRGDLLTEDSDKLVRICTLLRRKTGHDFSRYKTGTLVRRIQRRMQVKQIANVTPYLELLRQEPAEVEALFRDLLIGVTHFFRDPEAFAVLERDVIPSIVEAAGPDGNIRVWAPGCATGEEAYSIAILLRERILLQEGRQRVQIFAGDIDDDALELARQARYPEAVAEHITPERLERFFVKQEHTYVVSKEIREMCIFSSHNLIRDPPFSRLDLVLCRNLLIYLETDLQEHVSNLFHYALRPGGYLFLGPSESIAGPSDLFRTLDKKHRLFQRTETVTRPPLAVPTARQSRREGRAGPRTWTPRVATPGQEGLVAELERLLIDQYAPAWVIVNSQGEVVYFSPRTGRFLEPAAGTPSMDILTMARKGLRLDLRTALHRAARTRELVTHEGVAVETGDQVQTVNLIVRPLAELAGQHGLLMIVFQELGSPSAERASQRQDATAIRSDQLVRQLESDLRQTREHLQATVEEVESSNEELKSSNEELLSTNEELQSSNEELQTSKEELQSVNEELETINIELNHKVELLDRANSDLHNLLQSTRIPTVFLDGQLRIKRFTDAATHVFSLIETDVGRPISDITGRFEGAILPDMKAVLATLTPRERKLRMSDQSASYLLRILPYRRVDNVIDGLVVTFLDVTALEAAQQQSARLAAIVESSHDAIVGRSPGGSIHSWNQAAADMFGYTESEVMGRPLSLIVPPDRQADLGETFERLKTGEPPPPFESTLVAKGGRKIDVSVGISPIKDGDGQLAGASAIFRDITGLKRAEEALRAEVRHKDEFLAMLSHELRNPLAPIRSCLDVIRHPDRPDEQFEPCIRIMDRQLTHMTALVDQLMDASRIAKGKIDVALHDEDLVEVVRSAVEDQRRIVESLGLRLELQLPNRKLWIRGDELRLSQIVANLIGNAAKFTEPRGTLTVSLASEDERQAVLSVRDTGSGFDPREVLDLFRPFRQSSNLAQQTRGGLGLGLGLALVRALAEAHGGSVDAESPGPGQGATFRVRLPLIEGRSARRQAGVADAEAGASAKRRVLVIEDNVDAAEGLSTLLGLLGHTVKVAHDGPTGIAEAGAFRPDVVVCDLGLPGMSGYEVASVLRAREDHRATYLVALTGFDQPGDQQRTRQAGFNRHLTKPVDTATLRRILDEAPAR